MKKQQGTTTDELYEVTLHEGFKKAVGGLLGGCFGSLVKLFFSLLEGIENSRKND